MIPNVLSIAGSDPSGGAGIQADIKAISANGAYAMAAITALTAQNTKGVQAISLVDPDFVAAQIRSIFEDIRVDAVKIGMLGSADIVKAVAKALDECSAPIVLDTVMVAKGGDRLLQEDAVAVMRDVLVPRVTVITPNLPEAADLLGLEEVRNEDGMAHQADALRDFGAKAVLLKGGHLRGDMSRDVLLSSEGEFWMDGTRVNTPNTHGTGCTLSAAFAAHLAKGMPMQQAAKRAKAYVVGTLKAAGRLSAGQGKGPTHHFYDYW